MAENLLKQSISAPGFLGLNLQDSDDTADIRYAKIAENIVFDSSGRIAARKGWTALSNQEGTVNPAGPAEFGISKYNVATSEYSSLNTFKFMYELIKDNDNILVSGGGNKLYTGTNELVQATIKQLDNDPTSSGYPTRYTASHNVSPSDLTAVLRSALFNFYSNVRNDEGVTVSETTISYGAGALQKVDYYIPANPLGVVLYVHGGGWNGGDKAGSDELTFISYLLNLGYAVVSTNYRLVPTNVFPDAITDIKTVLELLLDNNAYLSAYDNLVDWQTLRSLVANSTLTIAGASAGAHLAVMGTFGYAEDSGGVWPDGVIGMVGPYDLVTTGASDADNPIGSLGVSLITALFSGSGSTAADGSPIDLIAGWRTDITGYDSTTTKFYFWNNANDTLVPTTAAVPFIDALQDDFGAVQVVKVIGDTGEKITPGIGYSITADNWQASALPWGDTKDATPHAYLVQRGHLPLVFHILPTPASSLGGSSSEYAIAEYSIGEYGAAASGTFDAHEHPPGGEYGLQLLNQVGTVPPTYSADTTAFKPNCVLAAYGRVWMADIEGDNQTVYFSQLLNGSDFAGGDSGYLSINSVFPNNDKIVGLAAHNGFLVIFGKNNIAIFSNPIDVTRLELQDFIPNVGCIARDSIQNTGSDVIFLSGNGLTTLARIIQEKSLPFRDLTKNIRDVFLEDVDFEDENNIKSIYSQKEGFYLLSLPTINKVYCFDVRALIENGAARVTTWKMTAYSFTVDENKDTLIGFFGYIGKYGSYNDNMKPYRMRYYSNYTNLGDSNTLKLLKKIGVTYRGQSTKNFTVNWGFDYRDVYSKERKTLDTGFYSEYAVAEYGIGTFGDGGTKNGEFVINSSGTGNVVQVGLEADIAGNYLAVQKLNIYAKQGRII